MWERVTRWSTQLHRECCVATRLSQWNRCSDPQGSGRGRESINPAKMKLCLGCDNSFASGKLYKCLQWSYNEDESSNAYSWNGEAGSFWGWVFWKSRVQTSSNTRSDLLSLMRYHCSCKTKEHQQRHRKNKLHNDTHKERKVQVQSHRNMYKRKT